MSFNFGSLQQKADQVIHNADEAIRKWVDFIQAPAGDVSFQYYDKNGNLQTTTFPNRNKVVNDFIANVNNAMEKTFYVDAVNGSDNNDGSYDTPFNTINKAVDSIPDGGTATIYLYKDQRYEITSHIFIRNKYIFFESIGSGNNNPKILHKSYTATYGNTIYYESYHINLYNSTLFYYSVDIEVEASADTSISSTSGHIAISCVSNSSVKCALSNIYIHGHAFFSTRDNTFGTLSIVKCNIVDEGYVVDTISSACSLNNYDSTIQNNNWVAGMVKDANGVPRNVISNIIL